MRVKIDQDSIVEGLVVLLFLNFSVLVLSSITSCSKELVVASKEKSRIEHEEKVKQIEFQLYNGDVEGLENLPGWICELEITQSADNQGWINFQKITRMEEGFFFSDSLYFFDLDRDYKYPVLKTYEEVCQ